MITIIVILMPAKPLHSLAKARSAFAQCTFWAFATLHGFGQLPASNSGDNELAALFVKIITVNGTFSQTL